MKIKSPIGIIAIILAVIALILFAYSAATGLNGSFAAKKSVKSGSMVKVEYTGTFENGTIFDSSENKAPLEFEAGAGQMIKGFDSAVIGMVLGQEKTVKIWPSEAYGDYNPELVTVIPRQNLPEEKNIKPGMMIMVSSQNGQQIPALITEVNESGFTIDLNHPLAGKTLIFKIKIVDIS